MNLEYLLNDFKRLLAEFEQAVDAHNANPDWTRANSLHNCAKRLRLPLKYIARLSKRCPTLTAHYTE